MLGSVSKTLAKFLRLTLGMKIGIPGIVVAIQSFGDSACWHPHLHALVAEGLFLESGYFNGHFCSKMGSQGSLRELLHTESPGLLRMQLKILERTAGKG